MISTVTECCKTHLTLSGEACTKANLANSLIKGEATEYENISAFFHQHDFNNQINLPNTR